MPNEKNAHSLPEGENLPVEGFEMVRYWIAVDRTKFDLDGFARSRPQGVPSLELQGGLDFSPRHGKEGTYHATLTWRISSKTIHLEINYHQGAFDHAPGEEEPFAEDLLPWLGGFLTDDSATCHLHTRFKFRLSSRRNTFALELSESPPCDAEVSGVSFQLPGKPNGAAVVRITRGRAHWYAEVIGERVLQFAPYSLYADVRKSMTILDKFLERSA